MNFWKCTQRGFTGIGFSLALLQLPVNAQKAGQYQTPHLEAIYSKVEISGTKNAQVILRFASPTQTVITKHKGFSSSTTYTKRLEITYQDSTKVVIQNAAVTVKSR